MIIMKMFFGAYFDILEPKLTTPLGGYAHLQKRMLNLSWDSVLKPILVDWVEQRCIRVPEC